MFKLCLTFSIVSLVATNPRCPQVRLSEVRESHSGQYECRPSNCHATNTNNTAVTLVVLDGESVLAVTVNMQRIKDECAVKTEVAGGSSIEYAARIARSSASCRMDINIEAAGVEKLA